MTDLLLHGHFYQPPRENPWTDRVDQEPGARPYHDWNARIDAECYRPNAYARIVDAHGRIGAMVNNYEWLSFNFGPTLVRWLQRHDRLTVSRLVEADVASRRRLGYGNAMAQAYSHAILPLASPRDRATQIRWGLAAFAALFDRAADGLWLPETAASRDVLDDLVDHGVKVVLLAAHQAARVRRDGGDWVDVRGGRVETGRAYRHCHRDGSRRSLAVLFFDADLSRGVAFGTALASSGDLIEHCRAAARRVDGGLVHAAFDGETAGHHHAWGDRALAHALVDELPRRGFRPLNPAAFVAAHPPEWEVEIDEGPAGEGTSWSCVHGVGRWLRDCGCRLAPAGKGAQAWRAPLRTAVHLLRDRAAAFFEEEAGRLLANPWAARDDYIQVLLAPGEDSRRSLLGRHGRGALSGDGGTRALELLELQHQVMLASTSCGWFFDDIAGLEARQVLRYVAHAGHLWEQLGGVAPWDELRGILGEARSHMRKLGTGADLLTAIRERDPLSPHELAAHVLLRAARPAATLPVDRLAGHRVRVGELSVDTPGAGGAPRRARARVALERENTGRRLELDAEVLDRPDDGTRVRVSAVSSAVETGDDRPVDAADARRGSVTAARTAGTGATGDGTGRCVELDLDDLLRSGGRELLEPVFAADLAATCRSTAVSGQRWQAVYSAGAAASTAFPPGFAAAWCAWDLDDVLGRIENGDHPADVSRLAERRARRGRGLGRSASAWLRRRFGERLQRSLRGSNGDADALAVVRRLLFAARVLRLKPSLHRAQEAFWARFAHRAASAAPAPDYLKAGRALGFSDALLRAAPAADGVRGATNEGPAPDRGEARR